MLYDDKQIGEREGLYTVVGAVVLAIVLFLFLAAYHKRGIAPTIDGRGNTSVPNATTGQDD